MEKKETLDDNSATNIAEDRTILDEKDITENATVMSVSTHSSTAKVTKNLQEGQMFGDYRIETLLGRGGMGAVYKAFDTKLQRFVALKLILSQNLTQTQLQRFFQEAQATAKLEHPNIVKLYSTGETPQHHLVMEYIDGDTLSRQYTKSYREIAELCSHISQALHFAHQNGIIHRDIKPSNIMITKDGVPKIMDFGLAKMTDIEQSLSNPGAILGTLAYMPVEQAEGRTVDKRSDVYSLGATLYELLCKRPPFDGESHLNVLHQIFNNDIISPTQLNPDIPRELEAICLKCLERNPEKRYQSAQLLADDLQNYLHHRPTMATPPNMMTYAIKFVMRHKIAVLLLSFVFFIVSAAGTFSYFQWQKAEVERKNAEEQRKKAVAESNNAQEQRKKAVAERKKAETERKNAERQRQKADAERKNANLHLAEIAKAKAEEIKKLAIKNSNSTLWADIALLCGRGLEFIVDQKPRTKRLRKQFKKLIRESIINYGLVWRKKGGSVVKVFVYNETIILFYHDGTVQYCHLYTGDIISKHKLQKWGKSVCFSPMKNGHIAFCTPREIVVWDYKAKKVFSQFTHSASVKDLVISDRFIATHDGDLVQIYTKTGEKIQELSLRTKVHIKGKNIQKFCDDLAISFAASGILRFDVNGHAGNFSIDNNMFFPEKYITQTNKVKLFANDSLVTISQDKELTVRSFVHDKLTHLKPVQLDSEFKIKSIDFDGKTLVVLGEDEIYMWKIKRKKREISLSQVPYGSQQKIRNTVEEQSNLLVSQEDRQYQLQFFRKLTLPTTCVAVKNGFLVSADEGEVKLWSLENDWYKRASKHMKASLPAEMQESSKDEEPDISLFDYRTDLAHGHYIEKLLESNPLQVVREIFQHDISKTLTSEPAVISYEVLK
ncbi:protein kinase domain-containing protein [Candidatus Uabimicrobium amorphum]|uniref:non-specific serine/threonine protein kinase n=1 Tax=Uabimicrobium amorphum TaxID=2596890 RepID=A0A5S9F2W2_UABAM|nr:protein kinase [Candidatus Uabimicrobium amorphum]BBM82899.1 putative serine/threonine-protein kinase PknB [Candidatus Uabimicrobium amorphum]